MKISTLLPILICLATSTIFSQNGLKGDYYDGVNFEKYIGTKIDTNIDYYWLWTPPFKGMDPSKCSVRWTGRIMAPESGKFTFSASVDDGVRVWVGNTQIIDNWKLNNMAHSKGTFHMEAGEYYDLKIEYFNAMAEAEITLFWELPKKQPKEEKKKKWYDIFWLDEEEEKVKVPSEYFFQPIEEKIAEVKDDLEVKEEETAPVKPKKKIVTPKPKKRAPKKEIIIPKESTAVAEKAIEKYIPKNVQFERTKTEILPQSFPELDRLAEFLTKNPEHKIKIEGHTDNVGNEEKNLQLSHSRARAVAAYLIKKGVHYERLSAEGFGGSRPLVKSEGGKYHPENRRVEFIVE